MSTPVPPLINPQSNRPMSSVVRRIYELEADISYRKRPQAGQLPFRVEKGSRPILISAPHGAAHMRKGELKSEDDYTAGLARFIAEESGAHAIYATHLSDEDPNFDERSRYKEAVAEICAAESIRFVLDLHGMSNRYKVGMAIGSMRGRSCPEQLPILRERCESGGFREVTLEEASTFVELEGDTFMVDHPKFTGGLSAHTVTRFVSEGLGIPAVQIEVCSTMRIVMREAHGPWPSVFYGSWRGIELVGATLAEVVNRLFVVFLGESFEGHFSIPKSS